jgi:hypothetical protein
MGESGSIGEGNVKMTGKLSLVSRRKDETLIDGGKSEEKLS